MRTQAIGQRIDGHRCRGHGCICWQAGGHGQVNIGKVDEPVIKRSLVAAQKIAGMRRMLRQKRDPFG